MDINEVHKLEQAVVHLLNFDGWNLQWSSGKYTHYDASGYTPKNHKCVIEMKFRKKYYETKLLEKYKYDKLFEMDEDIVKLYYISDPKGNYLFWLNNLTLEETTDMWCPDTTLWTKKKVLKPCYLLKEEEATIVNHS
tara:strand:- start:1831 stop:2241 length:411 start_codon:yes stop_codon:yes gene_type:complete